MISLLQYTPTIIIDRNSFLVKDWIVLSTLLTSNFSLTSSDPQTFCAEQDAHLFTRSVVASTYRYRSDHRSVTSY
jgi:hypothetical protein